MSQLTDAFSRVTNNAGRYMPALIAPGAFSADSATQYVGGPSGAIRAAGRNLGTLSGPSASPAIAGLMDDAMFALKNVGFSSDVPSEQQSNPTHRVNRLLRQVEMPFKLGLLPFATRREIVIQPNDAVLLRSDHAPAFSAPASMLDPTVQKRLNDSRTVPDRNPQGYAASDMFARAQHFMSSSVERLYSRTMDMGIVQWNYFMAVTHAERWARAFAGAALPDPSNQGGMDTFYGTPEYLAFFNDVVFNNSPAYEWHNFFAFDGVLYDEKDTHDMDPVLSTRQLASRACTNVKHGPVDMWDYTDYAGLTEGASISIIIRPHAVTADTKYYFGGDRQGPEPVHDANIPYSVPGAKIGKHTIFPPQMFVVCWPDGNTPPRAFAEYDSYVLPGEKAAGAAAAAGGGADLAASAVITKRITDEDAAAAKSVADEFATKDYVAKLRDVRRRAFAVNTDPMAGDFTTATIPVKLTELRTAATTFARTLAAAQSELDADVYVGQQSVIDAVEAAIRLIADGNGTTVPYTQKLSIQDTMPGKQSIVNAIAAMWKLIVAEWKMVLGSNDTDWRAAKTTVGKKLMAETADIDAVMADNTYTALRPGAAPTVAQLFKMATDLNLALLEIWSDASSRLVADQTAVNNAQDLVTVNDDRIRGAEAAKKEEASLIVPIKALQKMLTDHAGGTRNNRIRAAYDAYNASARSRPVTTAVTPPYARYRGYDGVIIDFGRVMFRTLVHANGRNGYRPPPLPKDLRPVTDMRPVQQRSPVPILICESLRGQF